MNNKNIQQSIVHLCKNTLKIASNVLQKEKTQEVVKSLRNVPKIVMESKPYEEVTNTVTEIIQSEEMDELIQTVKQTIRGK